MTSLSKYLLCCGKRLDGWTVLLIGDVSSMVLRMAMPLLFGALVGEITGCGDVSKTAQLFAVFLLLCKGLSVLFMLCGECWELRVFGKLELTLRGEFWDKVIRLPQRMFVSQEEAVWAERISSDVKRVVDGFRVCYRSLMSFVVFMSFTLWVVLANRCYVLIAFVAVGVAGFVITHMTEPKIASVTRKMREAMYAQYTSILDNIALHSTLSVFGSECRFTKRLKCVMSRATDAVIVMMQSYATFKSILMGVIVIAEAVIIVTSLWCFRIKQMEIGDVVAVVMLSSQVCAGVYELMQGYPLVLSGKESFASLCRSLEFSPTIAEGISLTTSKALISVESVCFGYQDQCLIKNVDLQVERGEFICIVGRNGVGKSTLGKLLLGVLEPTSGRIVRQELRHAEIPQRVVLFNDSILENIRLGDERISETAVQELVHSICGNELTDIHRSINTRSVSGGEGQLIGIARAMIVKPDLVVADELCNNLDVVAKCLVADALKRIKGQCAIVMITHDLDATLSADSVYVIRDCGLVRVCSDDPAERMMISRKMLLEGQE